MEMRCTQCQGFELEPGGGAKRLGRPRFRIDAYRCRACGHLELFAPHQV